MLQSPEARCAICSLGIGIPETFELTHNTGKDDPPDLNALGLGWECTEFPPNQSAMDKVHEECGEMGMTVPGFSVTGSDINKIREHSNPFAAFPNFVPVEAEYQALEAVFLERVIGGAKSKDVPGNDVLLLDHRRGNYLGDAAVAIKRALQKKSPSCIRLIFLVGWRAHQIGDTQPVPKVVVCVP
jgi:hypothetical protein